MTNEGQLGDLVDDPDHSSGAVSPRADSVVDALSSAAQGNGRSADQGQVADPAASEPAPVTGLDEVEWQTSYDRQSVDRFLVEVEAEKARLVAEIGAAEAREAEARERLAAQKAYNEDQLGALVVSARTELDRIEKEHAEAVTTIRAEALEKAAHILESARREAAAVGDASASLSRVAPTDAAAAGARETPIVDGPEPESEERTDVG